MPDGLTCMNNAAGGATQQPFLGNEDQFYHSQPTSVKNLQRGRMLNDNLQTSWTEFCLQDTLLKKSDAIPPPIHLSRI